MSFPHNGQVQIALDGGCLGSYCGQPIQIIVAPETQVQAGRIRKKEKDIRAGRVTSAVTRLVGGATPIRPPAQHYIQVGGSLSCCGGGEIEVYVMNQEQARQGMCTIQ